MGQKRRLRRTRRRVDDRCGVREIAVIEQSRRRALERGRVHTTVAIDVSLSSTIRMEPSLSRVTNTRSRIRIRPRSTRSTRSTRIGTLTGHLVPGKLNDQVADRSHRARFVRHRLSRLSVRTVWAMQT
jgi:hypothetical protein